MMEIYKRRTPGARRKGPGSVMGNRPRGGHELRAGEKGNPAASTLWERRRAGSWEPVFTIAERRLSGFFLSYCAAFPCHTSVWLRARTISLSDGENPRPSGIPGYEYSF